MLLYAAFCDTLEKMWLLVVLSLTWSTYWVLSVILWKTDTVRLPLTTESDVVTMNVLFMLTMIYHISLSMQLFPPMWYLHFMLQWVIYCCHLQEKASPFQGQLCWVLSCAYNESLQDSTGWRPALSLNVNAEDMGVDYNTCQHWSENWMT